jgi:hypothetical protein
VPCHRLVGVVRSDRGLPSHSQELKCPTPGKNTDINNKGSLNLSLNLLYSLQNKQQHFMTTLLGCDGSGKKHIERKLLC